MSVGVGQSVESVGRSVGVCRSCVSLEMTRSESLVSRCVSDRCCDTPSHSVLRVS